MFQKLLTEIRVNIFFVLFLPIRHQNLYRLFCLIVFEIKVGTLIVYIKLLLVSNCSKIDQLKFLVVIVGVSLHVLLNIGCLLHIFDHFVCCLEVERLIAAELDDLIFISVIHD